MIFKAFGHRVLPSKLHTAEDFSSHIKQRLKPINKDTNPILLIDDFKLPLLENLKQLGFNVTHKKDIKDIREVVPYNIIICDIKGVGKEFGSVTEGGVIITEVKKIYPNKYVFAFSGESLKIQFNEVLSRADAIIAKDEDVSDVALKIEAAMKVISDPLYQWKIVKGKLIADGFDLVSIAIFEHKFIDSIVENKDLTTILSEPVVESMLPEGRKLVSSLITFAIDHLSSIKS